MTPVLHVSREVADALPSGLSIAPVEGQTCPNADSSCFAGEEWTGGRFGAWVPCRNRCVKGFVPPVLSGRIAVAVDGAIIGTATAHEVLPVVAGLTGPRGVDAWLSIVRGGDRFYIRRRGPHGVRDQPVTAAALDLSPGRWVVTIEDWAPTCGAGECTNTNPPVTHEERAKCFYDGSPCQRVPVAAAPVGTITTWEAT